MFLDDNLSITNVKAANGIDTTVNYTDPQTNQTITTLPTKRVGLVLNLVGERQS